MAANPARPYYCSALLVVASVVWAAPVELQNPAVIQADEILIRPHEDWSTVIQAPGAEGDAVVLALQARLHVPGSKGGGCNWMLRVLLNDETLTESFTSPRLLNKPPFFDFAQGKYHFSWFSRSHDAWMAMFADTYDVDAAQTGQDTRFLFDISDYALPGRPLRIRLQYAQPAIPGVLKQDAPLAVRNITVGTLSREQIDDLRSKALSGPGGPTQIPIRTTPDQDEKPGEMPYEIAWAGRAEQPPAQVTFEDLTGWQAHALGDAPIRIAASRSHRTWRDQTMKISVGECPNFLLELRPPRPIAIPDGVDAVNCWIDSYHDYGAANAAVDVAVSVVDAKGAQATLPCGLMRGKYWELRQGLMPSAAGRRLRGPLRFEGITFSAGKINKPFSFHVESLAFFTRQRQPVLRPEGLHVPGFPTSEDNMLPAAPPGCTTRLEQAAQGAFVFTSASAEGDLVYTVDLKEGGLADVRAQFGDGLQFTPMAGAGIRIDTPRGPVLCDSTNSTLATATVQGDELITEWRCLVRGTKADYRVRYALRGRTLLVDVSFPGGKAEGLALGKVAGLSDAVGVEVPYLVAHRPPSPRIAMGSGVFASVLLDWYHSNCSAMDTGLAAAQPDADGLAINGGAEYARLTDGSRNDLAERVLVTVSPRIEDTLPSIATPRSDKIEDLARGMFVMSSNFTPEYYRTLSRYGLSDIIAIHFAGIWWRRAGEGFGMRWRPRPELTEEAVARYRAFIKGLGYKWGMLVNYTCFAPFNEYWDENRVSLTSAGALTDGWYGHYRPKPYAMAGLARIVGEEIRTRYATDCVYLDVHTNLGAAAYDFEAGATGAGMARTTILGNAETIAQVHDKQGALCSEGICRWLYAGVADMDYAQWADVTKPQDKPLLPDFDLLRIHPKQIGTAMGYSPTCFFNTEGLKSYYADPGKGTDHRPFYHYVAATLAHGHSAMIGYGYFPSLSRTIHYYSLLSGLQADYLPDTVSSIDWHSEADDKFVPTGEALRTGVRDDGRLRVTYSGGLTLWVNYNPDSQWQLTAAGRQFTLPPYGWVVHKPGEMMAYSALMDGRRVDYVDCPRYAYLNSGDRPVREGPITVDGAVLVLKGDRPVAVPCGDLGSWSPMQCEQYPMFRDRGLAGPPADRGVRLLRLDTGALLGTKGAMTVIHRDDSGRTVRTQSIETGSVELSPQADVVDYVLQGDE